MRKVFSVALMAAMVCLVGVAKNASATVTFNLVWTATTGAGITGSSTIAAAAGDQITLSILMTTDQTLGGHFVSIVFDTDLGNELNIVGGGNWAGTSFGTTAMSSLYSAVGPAGTKQVESGTGGPAGFFDTFNSGVLSGPLFLPVGTYSVGTLKFKANGALNPQPDGPDVWVGLFNTGVDGVLNNLNLIIPDSDLVFGNASVTTTFVPEPGTAALLGLGLVGLVLAGRRNRR